MKPPALGAVQRQKRSRSGSRSSSVFRGARGKDYDPVASEACDLDRIEPRHSRGTPLADGRPSQPRRSSAGLVAGGLPFGGHLALAPNLATHVPWPRSQEPSRARDPLRDHGTSRRRDGTNIYCRSIRCPRTTVWKACFRCAHVGQTEVRKRLVVEVLLPHENEGKKGSIARCDSAYWSS